ncbi:MAG: adenosine deaminase [Candidatus Eremiobacteraeota bacterium]|nr:adenosine deaminase [Candidatus Eremiobacteraeota bacterium]
MSSLAFLRGLPKVELHCHLEGTVKPATFLSLAQRHGVEPRYRPSSRTGDVQPVLDQVDAGSVYDFRSFAECLLVFAAVCRSLKDPIDYATIAQEYADEAVAQNVMYAEIFISPSVWQFFHPKLNVSQCLEAMRAVFDRYHGRHGVIVKFICDVTRNFGAESAVRTVELAASLMDLGVIGVGLGGDEARYPAALFAEAFVLASNAGLHTVAHAGEAAGAQSVRAAIDNLHAERIGHGIRAVADAQVVDLLARTRIPLEVCPTSNYFTGAVKAGEPHPLTELDHRGVIVTLDTDDPAIFRTDLTAEYAFAEGCAGLDAAIRFARNGIEASFADDSVKQAMRDRFERYCAEERAMRRSH